MLEDPFKRFILLGLERMGVDPTKLEETHGMLHLRPNGRGLARGSGKRNTRSRKNKVSVQTSRGPEHWPISDVRAALAYELKSSYNKDGIFKMRPSTPQIAPHLGYSQHSSVVTAQKRWERYLETYGQDPRVPEDKITQPRGLEKTVETPDPIVRTNPHTTRIKSVLKEVGVNPSQVKHVYSLIKDARSEDRDRTPITLQERYKAPLSGIRAALAYALSLNGKAEAVPEAEIVYALNYRDAEEVKRDLTLVREKLAAK